MVEYDKYSEYKDSGVDWLGEIPTSWSKTRISNLSQVVNGFPFNSELFNNENKGFPLIRIRDIKSPVPKTFTEEEFPEKVVILKDDILIGMDGDFNHVRWNRDFRALLNQRVCVLRTSDSLTSRWLDYVISYPLNYINERTFSTTVKHLSSRDLAKVYVPFPDIETQRRIVAFLDAETKKIDDSVSSMESLISLLTEKRAALISETVTRGVPGEHTEFKDSGVEWLGEIPVGWSIGKIRRSIASVNGGSWGDEKNVLEKTIRCIRVADFDRHTSSIHSKNPTDRSYLDTEISKKAAHKGDLILEKSGGGEKTPVGNVVIYSDETPVMYSNFVTRLVIKKNQNSYFWCYMHKSLYENGLNLKAIKQNTGIQNLDVDEYLNEKVVFPPLNEQESIVNFLDVETSKIDTIIEETKQSIALMKEKRQVLISDVVTGKIDVRNISN